MQNLKFTTTAIWEESIILPTYPVSEPEKSPLFIENRAYQGSSGRVYPLPVTEKIYDQKEDISYRAVFLENDFIKIMVLPELGGRIQRAYDKTNGYDFVYYNHVIKPALVGLTGPWISGGIEFNWPQHHRPCTYSPIDYRIQENNDGSATIFVSEIDKMYGTKGMASFTLYPDKAYIEIKGRLFNRTDFPQTFLWWANPAVPVNDYTFSVFPPDVKAVMDHGKRAVSTFPIATGEYYKYDYSEGIDISMYKNIKVPTSYMAAHSDYDFVGNYDTNLEAGLLHVADHHISPGKKQWTWGNSDFGRSWDRNLTDNDGPYIELMTGVFADNQPDFTWLKPYEEKTFTQYFLPYKGVGHVKNATCDALINLEFKQQQGILTLYTTSLFENLTITVHRNEKLLYQKETTCSPVASFQDTFSYTEESTSDCQVIVTDKNQKILVSYKTAAKKNEPTPNPAKELPSPEELKSTEELYLAGQHLEQYRHATREPADYYLEGLKRDGSDLRLNNSYGLLLLKRGCFSQAKEHFEAAIKKQTWKNPNPYHGECYFNLGLALWYLGDDNKAFDAFYKSTWSMETQSSGFYWLALLSCRQKNYQEALDFAEHSLIYNWHNMKVRNLYASLLRILKKDNTDFLEQSLKIDPLSIGCLYEKTRNNGNQEQWLTTMRTPDANFKELALDYMKAGLYEDAISILKAAPEKTALLLRYIGYAYYHIQEYNQASHYYHIAEEATPDYCFPNKTEEILILETGIQMLDRAPFAKHALADLYYDKKQYPKAIALWEESLQENRNYAMTFRNLAIAIYSQEKDIKKALSYMEKAITLEPQNTRFLIEYDQLCGINNIPLSLRLATLEKNTELLENRDVLFLAYITLLNNSERFDEALSCLHSHTFHPWEGGEGKVSAQYRYALTCLALEAIRNNNYTQAISLLEDTFSYPENLGEGKLPNVQDNLAEFLIGICLNKTGLQTQAEKMLTKASIGMDEPCTVLYYHDQPADSILYQGLAHQLLGNISASKKAFHKLKSFGEKHLFDQVDYEYFAVSLPELDVFPTDIKERHITYCKYLIALSEIGLGHLQEARKKLQELLESDQSHQGALFHLRFLDVLYHVLFK